MTDATTTTEWHQTACILCSINCGIEVKLDGRRFARIRGDKSHPTSANTAFRDPAWRKKDPEGALRIHPDDAAGIGAGDGSRVRITTTVGSAEVTLEVTDTMHLGHISLPNGLGLDYPDADGTRVRHGVAPNELTSTENRDWFAGTPLHKNVRARLEVVS